MAGFGGSNPYPRRFARNVLLTALTESIHAGRGSSVSQEKTSIVWLESHCIARALHGAWGTNRRIGYCFQPAKCPAELLPRWRTILRIYGGTDTDMRERWARRWTYFSRETTHALIMETLQRVFGSTFVGVDPASIDNVDSVDADPSEPYLAFDDKDKGPWIGTPYRVIARLEPPAGMSPMEFYDLTSLGEREMDEVLPAWYEFVWYRPPETGAPIAVTGGASAGGFYLDERNLDNSALQ